MIPTHKEHYDICAWTGLPREIWTGFASWTDDKGLHSDRSIKFAYRDKSGKISRGCPELPFDLLVDLMVAALKQREITKKQAALLQDTLNKTEFYAVDPSDAEADDVNGHLNGKEEQPNRLRRSANEFIAAARAATQEELARLFLPESAASGASAKFP